MPAVAWRFVTAGGHLDKNIDAASVVTRAVTMSSSIGSTGVWTSSTIGSADDAGVGLSDSVGAGESTGVGEAVDDSELDPSGVRIGVEVGAGSTDSTHKGGNVAPVVSARAALGAMRPDSSTARAAVTAGPPRRAASTVSPFRVPPGTTPLRDAQTGSQARPTAITSRHFAFLLVSG